MKRLCIFDLDGTLVNSIEDLADSVNIVLERYRFPLHEIEEYKHFVGDGTLKLIERALPEQERIPDTIEKLHGEFSEEYRRRAVMKTRPYSGITEVIKILKKRGVILAVASNKPDRFSRYIVDELFEKDSFDMIRGKTDGVPAKPKPDIILGIMKAWGVSAEDTCLVGDSDVDVMTAHNAGIECIGCSWGFRGRQELESAGADFIADDPLKIADYI